MLKNKIQLLLLLMIVVSSCTSYKKVPYLQDQNLKDLASITLPSQAKSSMARYKPGDVLGISVNANVDPSLVADFNLPLQPAATPENSDAEVLPQGQGRQTYLVGSTGSIDFPILGQVKVEGLTREELEVKLKASLKSYLKMEPVVTIRLLNYRISVLGEVSRPGQFTISRERINVLEALTLAGDMTIYGRRDNVNLIREQENGDLKIFRLDLTNTSIASSPEFYLQQNDMLYIEPNKTKAKSSDIGAQTGIWFSVGSVLLSVVGIVISIMNMK